MRDASANAAFPSLLAPLREGGFFARSPLQETSSRHATRRLAPCVLRCIRGRGDFLENPAKCVGRMRSLDGVAAIEYERRHGSNPQALGVFDAAADCVPPFAGRQKGLRAS